MYLVNCCCLINSIKVIVNTEVYSITVYMRQASNSLHVNSYLQYSVLLVQVIALVENNRDAFKHNKPK